MDNIYYVYVYCDPRKPGRFDYGINYIFSYEPFYVGKGKESRNIRHLTNYVIEHGSNKYKNNKIKYIKKLGYDLTNYIHIFRDNISNNDACDLEKQLILNIGRLDLHTGPLTNLTDGGDGMLGNLSPNKGKTYEEIYGIEKAAQLKKQKSERFKGHKNPQFGKIGTFTGKKLSQEAIEKGRLKRLVPIVQMNKQFDIIQIWPSAIDAAKYFGVKRTAISNCVNGRSHSSCGFYWRHAYLHEKDINNDRPHVVSHVASGTIPSD